MKTIYFAHSMTNGKQNLDKVNSLIEWLKKKRYRILKPNYFLFADSLANEAIHAIGQADIVIADVTDYSHGVGFELGYAYSLKKQIIVISNIVSRNKISKFLLGLFPEIIFYEDGDDLPQRVSFLLEKIGKSRSTSIRKSKRN